jgi:hypothetical protein
MMYLKFCAYIQEKIVYTQAKKNCTTTEDSSRTEKNRRLNELMTEIVRKKISQNQPLCHRPVYSNALNQALCSSCISI